MAVSPKKSHKGMSGDKLRFWETMSGVARTVRVSRKGCDKGECQKEMRHTTRDIK
jgi:hypothetical protein